MIVVGHQAPDFTTPAVLANGEIKNDFNFNLEDISTKERLEMRQRVINCSIEDLIRVSKKYLTKGDSKKSILAGESYREEASSLGLTLKEV